MYYIVNVTHTKSYALKATNPKQAKTLLSKTFGKRPWNLQPVSKAAFDRALKRQVELMSKCVVRI